MVSVVLTSYNHERYLRRAIESVFEQTYSDFELIIIDDASHDSSPSIAREYKDRAKLILREQNAGTYPALNEATRAATGEWIAILNSDDYWLPEKLAAQMSLPDEYSFRFTNGHFVDENDEPCEYQSFGRNLFRVPSGQMLARLVYHNHCYPSTVMFRKSLWEEVGGFSEDLACLGDWDCFLRMAERTEFGFVDEDLVAYRVHGEQTSRRISTMRAEDLLVRENILAAEGRYLRLGVSRAALGHSAAALGTQYHLLGRSADARRMYLHSLRLNPTRGKSVLRFLLACVRSRIAEP